LLGLGLQHKTVDELAKELDLPATQLLGLFNRAIRKILDFINRVLESALSSQLVSVDVDEKTAKMLPVAQSLSKELDKAAKELKRKQDAELEKLKNDDFSQFAIKGSDETWSNVLSSSQIKTSGTISIKSGEKRVGDDASSEKKKRKKTGDDKKTFGKGWKNQGKKKFKG
jgi:N-acetyltransferase 10